MQIVPQVRAAGKADLDMLYSELLKDPANLELLYEYAQAAIDVADFEAAISALEGMLVVSRNQPRVLFELGTLYQRLGANQVAESYFTRARALIPENEAVPSYMEAYIIETENENSRNTFTGLITLGYRYQENPLSSPESDEILSGGVLVPPRRKITAESDSNWYSFIRLNHKYKISPGVSMKTRGILYKTDYNDQSQLNYASFGLTTGPEILLSSTGDRVKLKPYLTYKKSDLNGDDLSDSWGAGLSATYGLNTQTSIKGELDYSDRDYHANNGSIRTAMRSGDQIRFRLRWNTEVKRGHFLTIGAAYETWTPNPLFHVTSKPAYQLDTE